MGVFGYLFSLPSVLADIAQLLRALLKGQNDMKAMLDLIEAKLTKLDEVVPGVVELLTSLTTTIKENKDAPEKLEEFAANIEATTNRLAAALVAGTTAAAEPTAVVAIEEAAEEKVTAAEEAVEEEEEEEEEEKKS